MKRERPSAHGAERRARMVDNAIVRLFDPFARPGLALIALGGYGRLELCPGSDIDLLFVHAPGPEAEIRPAVDAVLYPLWDAGLDVSHAVRTPAECQIEAEARLESLTALLDARLLAGPKDLLVAARDAALEVARRDSVRFVRALEDSRRERRGRFGFLSHTLEPNLKESLGGLRDIHLAGWIERAFHPRDAPELRGSAQILLAVRTALHVLAGRGEDRLRIGYQDGVSSALRFVEESGWEARDVLMRTVFAHGRVVDVAVEGHLESVAASVGRSGRSDGARRDSLGGRESAGEASEGLGRRYARAQPPGAHVSLLDGPRSDAAGARWPPELRSGFVRLLTEGDSGARSLEVLDAHGGLGELIPEWSAVRGRPQRDPYHRYPVDVHLMRTAAETARLLRQPDDPLAVEAAERVDDPESILLGALLHDIGKVGRGSHVAAGVEVAGRILDRMGVGEPIAGDVLFLVREHLLLSDTATRRNVDDQDLILHVAARVGDQHRLAMLYLLTVADAVATGHAASSPWRMALIRELVAKVHRVFDRGLMDRDRAQHIKRAEAALMKALLAGGSSQEDALEFLSEVPPAYVLWARPRDAARHIGLILPPPAEGQCRVEAFPGRVPGTWNVVVSASDRLGVLARLAGAMALSGLSILTAQAFSTENGIALDAFEVRSAFDEEIGEDRLARFRSILSRVLRGEIDLGERIRSQRAHYTPQRTDIPVRIRVDDGASDAYTVVEVHAPDRLGLLYDLARTFAEQEVDVHSARVATYASRVVDVFYVTDRAGTKLVDRAGATELCRVLEKAARS